MSEYNEHRAVCQYLKLQYPKVIFLSDGSGVRVTPGIANQIKNLKSGRGIPDLIILEPRGGYHGLCIEMKAKDSTVFKKDGSLRKDKHLEEQWEVLKRLLNKGYYATFAIGRDDAMAIIDDYFGTDR